MIDAFALPVARVLNGEVVTRLHAGQTLKIGRASDSHIIIEDPKVSRNHAQLEWNGSGFSVRDLGSVNGTSVNGERLGDAPRPLRDGDELLVHTHRLLYFIERADPVTLPQVLGRVEESVQRGGGARLVVIAGPDCGQEFPLWGEQITLGRGSRANTARPLTPLNPGIPVSGGTGFGTDLPTLSTHPRLSRPELPVTWEIRLADPAVSRPHARLQRHQGRYYLLDLQSANGTQHNGQPVTAPVALADGDLIVIGGTHLRFDDPAGSAPPTEPPAV